MRGIITADWHLRADRPRCRKDDDWIDTQKNALSQIADICEEKQCDLYVVGDLYHRSNEFRMVRFVQILARKMVKSHNQLNFICGNHDLLYHSSSNIDNSAIGLLINSDNCCPMVSIKGKISAPNFDEELDESAEYMFIHTLCFPNMESMPPNVNATYAKELLEEHPNAKWIFTGDYHRNFHYEWNGRHVVNPGCLIRQASDMKDYQCGVYFVDTTNEVVEFIPIIDNEELVDDSYIMEEKERDKRIGDFVDKLSETNSLTLDYIDNVEKALESHSFDDDVVNMVHELMEV